MLKKNLFEASSVCYDEKVRLKIIQKYLIYELAPQFFMAVFIFSFVLSLVELFTYQNKFSFGFDILFWSKISFFLLLQNASLIIPISFFYACLSSLGFMISQNEVIAIKSCGFSYLIFLKPLLFLGFFLSLLCFSIGGFMGPWGYKKATDILADFIQKKNVQLIKEGMFNEDFFEYVIYIEKIDQVTKTLKNIILFPKQKGEQLLNNNQVIFAQSGMLFQNDDPFMIIVQLKDGTYNQYSDGFQKVSFEKANIKLNYSNTLQEGKAEKKKDFITLLSESSTGPLSKIEVYKIINNSFIVIAFCLFGFGFLGMFATPNRALSFLVTISVASFYYGYIATIRTIIQSADFAIPIMVSLPTLLLFILSFYFIYRARKR